MYVQSSDAHIFQNSGSRGGAYLDLAAAGYRYPVVCPNPQIVQALSWLARQGIDSFHSGSLFGFRCRADAVRFAETWT